MRKKLGENLEREWAKEAFPQELWNAARTLRTSRLWGLNELSKLAAQGSPLAMMYLGHALVKSGSESDVKTGCTWLMKSAEAGSIEGRLQLAIHYKQQAEGERAQSELSALVAQGYTPAMYLLASILYDGKIVERDLTQAIHLLKTACSAGHLPSHAFLSSIYRKERVGFIAKLRSYWLCLAKIPAFIWYLWRHPNSDCMRPLRLPHNNA